MPLYYTKCPKCGYEKRILSFEVFDKIPDYRKECPECNTILVRNPKGPSTSVKEVLDNGAMPKAVERFADIEEMMHERNKNADPNAGRKNVS